MNKLSIIQTPKQITSWIKTEFFDESKNPNNKRLMILGYLLENHYKIKDNTLTVNQFENKMMELMGCW